MTPRAMTSAGRRGTEGQVQVQPREGPLHRVWDRRPLAQVGHHLRLPSHPRLPPPPWPEHPGPNNPATRVRDQAQTPRPGPAAALWVRPPRREANYHIEPASSSSPRTWLRPSGPAAGPRKKPPTWNMSSKSSRKSWPRNGRTRTPNRLRDLRPRALGRIEDQSSGCWTSASLRNSSSCSSDSSLGTAILSSANRSPLPPERCGSPLPLRRRR